MKWREAWTPVRDIGLFALGAFVILYQQLTGRVNLDLLLVAASLLGIPGSIAALSLLRGNGNSTAPATPAPSSQSPSSPSSQQSPSS